MLNRGALFRGERAPVVARLPRPLGLNTSFGYQPDSHVAFRYANVWLAFTNTFNPSQRGSGTSSSGQ